MTGWQSLIFAVIWITAFGLASLIVLKSERKKEKRQMQRNMDELRMRRNRHAIIEDMEREWQWEKTKREQL